MSKPTNGSKNKKISKFEEVNAIRGNTIKNNTTKNKPKSGKKVALVLGVICAVLAFTYLGGVMYFQFHFLLNTQINGRNFSGQRPDAVREYFIEQVNGYRLTFLERDGASDTMDGSSIHLTFRDDGQITTLLEEQNQWLWPMSLFTMIEEQASITVDFDQTELEQQLQKIQAVQAEQIPPVNAQVVFEETAFVIKPEQPGTEVNMPGLRTATIHAISNFQSELNLVEKGLYVAPTYTSESEPVLQALEKANHYAQASITYEMGDDVVVDAPLIASWITISDTYEVTLHEDQVEEWVKEFSDRFTTVGTTRYFTTPRGREVSVSRGAYGWRVNAEETFVALLSYIQNGETIRTEPVYSQRAASHGATDWGDTFIQVDRTNQVMWYIVNGEVVLESPIVTGLANTNRVTPTGVFTIIEKDTNRYLRGPRDPETGEFEWESFVSFWMRITWSGIGFHDATWQTSFGGTRYRTHGSRGCINMPLGKARELFQMLPMGTPVVIHN